MPADHDLCTLFVTRASTVRCSAKWSLVWAAEEQEYKKLHPARLMLPGSGAENLDCESSPTILHKISSVVYKFKQLTVKVT